MHRYWGNCNLSGRHNLLCDYNFKHGYYSRQRLRLWLRPRIIWGKRFRILQPTEQGIFNITAEFIRKIHLWPRSNAEYFETGTSLIRSKYNLRHNIHQWDFLSGECNGFLGHIQILKRIRFMSCLLISKHRIYENQQSEEYCMFAEACAFIFGRKVSWAQK